MAVQKACHERISGEKMTATTTHFASNIVRRRTTRWRSWIKMFGTLDTCHV